MSEQPGFAVRHNGTNCLANEIDCGQTVRPYRGCCPSNLECPMQYNIACCPTGQNCTSSLLEQPEPSCANTTWNLFDNGGYFCCRPGLIGYAATTDSNGCASPGYQFRSGERLLSTVSVGQVASSTFALPLDSSSTGTAPTTSTTASDTGGSSTPIGAIVGGVVGGVALLALIGVIVWILMRKRRQSKEASAHNLNGVSADSKYYPAEPQELGGATVHEADGVYGLQKLPVEAPANQAPVELPGSLKFQQSSQEKSG